jgi:hypothetical protein
MKQHIIFFGFLLVLSLISCKRESAENISVEIPVTAIENIYEEQNSDNRNIFENLLLLKANDLPYESLKPL